MELTERLVARRAAGLTSATWRSVSANNVSRMKTYKKRCESDDLGGGKPAGRSITSIPGHRCTRATRVRDRLAQEGPRSDSRARRMLSAFPDPRPAISPIRRAHLRRKL